MAHRPKEPSGTPRGAMPGAASTYQRPMGTAALQAAQRSRHVGGSWLWVARPNRARHIRPYIFVTTYTAPASLAELLF